MLDQVVEELRHGHRLTDEITKTAAKQGRKLWLEGFTVGQVVHGYGDVCQSVTELAVELAAPISADDFRTLNRCRDDAIAARSPRMGATKRPRRRRVTGLRNLANTALSHSSPAGGNVGVGGSTDACCSAVSSPYALSMNARARGRAKSEDRDRF